MTRVPRLCVGALLVGLACSCSDGSGPSEGAATASTSAKAPTSTSETVTAGAKPPVSTNPAVATTTPPAAPPDPKDRGPTPPDSAVTLQRYPVPEGMAPHDVAPAPDGTVWFTGQGSGELGRLDPRTGAVTVVALGAGSRPHGVIVGPDGAAWVTDGGLNAIMRVEPATLAVARFDLPVGRANANLNTAAFDGGGVLWFTGQNGIYGRLDPTTRVVEVFDAPSGRGPYGIAATPAGQVWFVSLAGSYLARIDTATAGTSVVQLPTPAQGARRTWSDSSGRLWVAEWNAGQVAVHDPATNRTTEWRLPGARPQAYAVYVDERDDVWLTDFGANALVRFDPTTETFASFPFPSAGANVRQLLGRPGEVWGAESAADALVVARSPAVTR